MHGQQKEGKSPSVEIRGKNKHTLSSCVMHRAAQVIRKVYSRRARRTMKEIQVRFISALESIFLISSGSLL